MTEQALVKTGNGGLSVFGERDAVRELTARLQATMPGGRKMSEIEARSLAQISLAHGLDPFNGEAWMIPGSGLMVGIKGLRKTARRMAREEGGSYWTELKRVEPAIYNEPENAVVYECHLRDTMNIQAYTQAVHTLTTANIPYKDAVAFLGQPPVTVGVGVAKPDEKTKMDIHQRARKRAEADAIKQRYDVDFIGANFSDEDPIVDAVFEEIETGPRSEDEILTELGFEVESEPEEPTGVGDDFEDQLIFQAIESGYTENGFSAKKTLSKCTASFESIEDGLNWFKAYRGWREMGADSNKAANLANSGDMPE